MRPMRSKLRADFDPGDHLHPDDAGYQAMADAFDLGMLHRQAHREEAVSLVGQTLALRGLSYLIAHNRQTTETDRLSHSLPQSAAAHQIHRKTAEPVAAFVVFALDAVQSRRLERTGERGQRLCGVCRRPAVSRRSLPASTHGSGSDPPGDTLCHRSHRSRASVPAPRAAETRRTTWGTRARQDTAHHVGLRQAGRQKILARGLVGERAVRDPSGSSRRRAIHELAEFVIAGGARVVQHQARSRMRCYCARRCGSGAAASAAIDDPRRDGRAPADAARRTTGAPADRPTPSTRRRVAAARPARRAARSCCGPRHSDRPPPARCWPA